MPVPYNSVSVANTFLSLYGSHGGIEHMKLQKLVYCSYGWWLAHAGLEGDRLTTDRPEIWRHGPVFPDLYHAFKIFGRKPIKEMQSTNPFLPPDVVDTDDNEIRSMVAWIWGRYGHLSSFTLSDMTHKPGTPWYRVAQDRNFTVQHHTTIPDKYIIEEFEGLMARDKAVPAAQQAPQQQPQF